MKFARERVWLFTLMTALCALYLSGTVQGQKSGEAATPEVGKHFPVYVATPASGKWAEKYPFNPDSYGKVRGHCPISSNDPKIVLCTLALDKNFFRLAAAVDTLLARQDGLEWSLIQVADSKGAQRGGYSAKEVEQRMAELQKLARRYKIKHLSFTLSATDAAGFASGLGLAEDKNLLVAHLAAGDDAERDVVVKWAAQYHTSKLSGKAIKEIVASLEKSVANK